MTSSNEHMKSLWICMCIDTLIYLLLDVIKRYGVSLTWKQTEAIMPIMIDTWNHSTTVIHCGHTLCEIGEPAKV